MRILDRHICRAVLFHALLGLAVFTFIFFVPRMAPLMELIARHSAAPADIANLILYAFPGVLSFTVPIALLIGILIGLGGLSADSELIAMNALGMGLRRLLVPVGWLAAAATAVTLCMTLWLGPLSVRLLRARSDQLRSSQASSQVQPRVFDERFPHLVLYVQDVSAAATHWRGIFLAESDTQDVARMTVAKEAIVIADREQGKLELHLRDGSMHESSPRESGNYTLSAFAQRDLSVALTDPGASRSLAPIASERPLRALLGQQGPGALEASVEFHRRLALPAACLAMALMALPLAARPRRGSRAGGFLLAVLLICAYYLIFTVGAGLARDGTLPAWLGIWTANIVAVAMGLLLLPGMGRMPDNKRFSRILGWLSRRPRRETETLPESNHSRNGSPGNSRGRSLALRLRPSGGNFPQLLDLYLLRNFIYYFALLLAGFLVLFQAFTFFELLDDIAQHRTGTAEVVNYFLYLSVYLFYQLAPLACLIAVLVTLGIMAKNNELVALKAAGVSLYRIALPLVAVGLCLAAGLVMLDDAYLPYANQRQDALRNMIRGRPAQTFYQPGRSWIFGSDSKVYNYQLFDPDRSLFGRLSIFELDPDTFALRRRIYADRARWQPEQEEWVLESGWVRSFSEGRVVSYHPFAEQTFPELREAPGYFNREVRQAHQMNWQELRRYINELGQAGFDVARLSVQLQRKLAFPLIVPIVMLLAVPFSLVAGTRGAVGGLALGLGLGVTYWAASALLEALGAVGQLPPVFAAWTPDAAFFFVSLYFFLKMPT
jgi:LPS export ABC transporter permease LptF/LPS export ABC transporter permease LptG